ncbi:MAG TPA: hypothetical protein VG755_03250 [Nannocystaceae bacterium]|nr:hypothetical protein [Nannocystaceae bacterium]
MRSSLFRFGFVYLVLYHVPVFMPLWDALVPWVGAHVLGIDGEIPNVETGSADRRFDWVLLLCRLVIALVAAIVWSIAAPRERYDERLRAGLRIGLRYALAFWMLGYGLHKLIPLQFGEPGVWRLVEPYGASSPMGLLWTFMGHSPAYVMFTGFAETLGGALLFARRTTTLGALVVVGVMANVVMLNFCYDVPVKLFSTHLLVTALVLLAPDARRLLDLFVYQRPTAPAPLRPPFATPRARRRWLVGKSLAIAVLVLVSVFDNVTTWIAVRERDMAEPPVHRVTTSDETRWRHVVIVPEHERLVAVRMNGERVGYRCEVKEGGVFVLTALEGEGGGTLVETKVDDDHTLLTGELDGAQVELALRRVDASEFLLPTRGFHWVSETPFNR